MSLHECIFQIIWPGASTALKMAYYSQETFAPRFWAFTSRFISAVDNCFSSCGWGVCIHHYVHGQKRVLFKCYKPHFANQQCQRNKTFYQHPDTLKSLIRKGFYKLLNWLTMSTWPQKLLPEWWFYLQGLTTEKGSGISILPQRELILCHRSLLPLQPLNLYNALTNKAKII